MMPAAPRLDLTEPDALRARQLADAVVSGVPAVGLVGAIVPTELIVAAGCRPVTVMARAEDWAEDAHPMEPGHEVEVRSLFRQIAQGACMSLDLLIVPGTTDGYRYLYTYLKQVRRQGAEDVIPPVLLFDLLLGDQPAVRRYSRDRLADLVRRLEVLSGVPYDEARMGAALFDGNRARRAGTSLERLRRDGGVSGTCAHGALRAGAFCEPRAYAEAVETLVATRYGVPACRDRPRLLLSSAVPLVHERLHVLIEAAGAIVIAEDDAWGSRRASPEVALEHGPLLDAVLDHLGQHAVSPRMPQERREAWMSAHLSRDICDGVVFYVPPDDQSWGWRLPTLRARAAAAGLPTLLLREEVLDPASIDVLAAAVAGFVETLRPGATGTAR